MSSRHFTLARGCCARAAAAVLTIAASNAAVAAAAAIVAAATVVVSAPFLPYLANINLGRNNPSNLMTH